MLPKPPPALIRVVYKLSDIGRAASLAAGRNSGEDQTLLVRPPNTENETLDLADAVQALREAASKVDGQAPSDLNPLVQAVVAACQTLGFLLDPSAALNTTHVTATVEQWAAMQQYVHINPKGLASFSVGGPLSPKGCVYWTQGVVGYELLTEEKWAAISRYTRQPNTEYPGPKLLSVEEYPHSFDSLQTLEELLTWRREFEARLEREKAAVEAKVAEIRPAWEAANKARKLQEQVAYCIRGCQNSLQNTGSYAIAQEEFDAVPEVIALRERLAKLEAGDTTAVWSLDNPTTKTNQAIRNRKNELETEALHAWVREHGSVQLKFWLDEGYLKDNMKTYKDERLALEFPDWAWASGTPDAHTSPAIEDIALLRQAEAVAEGNPAITNVRLMLRGNDPVVWAHIKFLEGSGNAVYTPRINNA